MGDLQATWLVDGRLLFWASAGALEAVVADELPELAELAAPGASAGKQAHTATFELAAPGRTGGRWSARGLALPIHTVLPLLPAARNLPHLSDSVRCWSMAARLALELAAKQAVIPGVREGEARWSILLARPEDHARYQELSDALPVAARLAPTRDKGPVRLHTSGFVVHSFLDHVVDALYRQNAWPGTARGWMLELGMALRGPEPVFHPKDARFFGVTTILASWAGGADGGALRLGMRLEMPEDGGPFTLHMQLHPPEHSDGSAAAPIPLERAWTAGGSLDWEGRTWQHPAWAALRGLARARRIYPALAASLSGATPSAVQWTAAQAWAFLADGARALRDAGFLVELPASFHVSGSRRIRARMRLELGDGERPVLGEQVPYRWEVTLGDRVLSGEDFQELLGRREPIVRFRGKWTLVDPAEIARLPKGLPAAGSLDTGAALRAVLTGEHDGVPVVADHRLQVMLEALRHPPERRAPAGLRATLRPYQERGFAWLACLGDLGLGACLADDMGLGKTLQVIAHLLDRRQRDRALPSLIVCPTSLIGNWTRELHRFAPELTVARHHGASRSLTRARGADVVLTTYGLLARDAEALAGEPWDVVALDEAQSVKNPDAHRARAAFQLKARHRVALTGTPVENRLDELWSIFRFVVPGLLGARGHFRKHTAIPVERFGDEDAATRLRLGTAPFLLRRLKTDANVVHDLPDKVERNTWCSLTAEQAKLYRQVADEHLERVATATRAERRGQVLALLTALKQVCNHPSQYLKDELPNEVDPTRSGKTMRAIGLLEAVVDAGERAIIFTQYREMGKLLAGCLETSLGLTVPFLHGGVSVHERDEMVRRFQEDASASPLLLISLRAGGVGLNLTQATTVLHYDRWWNPAVEDQATDRAFRIGQHRNVQVHKLICQGTLEERIHAMLQEKRHLADAVVSTGDAWIAELDDRSLHALVALGDDAVMEEE